VKFVLLVADRYAGCREALDEAMLGSVLKYLGSGVLAVQTQAAAALRRRLGNEQQNGGTEMASVAAQIVSGGGLHRFVDWLASEEPTLQDEGARTLVHILQHFCRYLHL
jgi:hypothetical protein